MSVQLGTAFANMLENSGFNTQQFAAAMGQGADVTHSVHAASGGGRVGERSFVFNENIQPSLAANSNEPELLAGQNQPEQTQKTGYAFTVEQHLEAMALNAENALVEASGPAQDEMAASLQDAAIEQAAANMTDPNSKTPAFDMAINRMIAGLGGINASGISQGIDCSQNDVACQAVGNKPAPSLGEGVGVA